MRPRAALAAAVPPAAWMIAHRTAPAVRGWRAPDRPRLAAGPLHAEGRTSGDGPVVVLLHGITASSRSFGADVDAVPADVVAVDLLGFGRSMDVTTDAYDRAAHVGALHATLASLGLDGRPLVLVGHSMGSVAALHLAAALPEVRAVVAASAPLYDDEHEALEHIGDADPLARLLAVGGLAERVCAWMCAHRRTAAALWAAVAPRYPVPVAVDGVLHTWPAYRGSLQHLVLDSAWRGALAELGTRGVPVHLVQGDRDGVPVEGRAEQLARTHPLVSSTAVAGADHALPMSHPGALADAARRALDAATPRRGGGASQGLASRWGSRGRPGGRTR